MGGRAQMQRRTHPGWSWDTTKREDSEKLGGTKSATLGLSEGVEFGVGDPGWLWGHQGGRQGLDRGGH